MQRVIIGITGLIWASCIFVAFLIAIEDSLLYVQRPKNSMHESQAALDVTQDQATGAFTFTKKQRPLSSIERFEVMMSLGRSPMRSDEASWLLVIFVLTSQVLILSLLQRTGWRWLLYALLLVIGTGWIWYQATFWLGTMCTTFMNKLLGGPITWMGLPTIFFLFLAPRPGWTGKQLIMLAVLQLVLFYPWLYVWGFTELMLGWVWI